MSKSVSVLRFINTSVKSRFSGTGAVRITASPPLSPLSTFFYSNTAAFSTTATFCKESDDKRYTKTIWKEQKPVDYNELKAITNSPNDTILLIDVREPDEVALGSIPSSVNLPLSSFEKSLSMDEGDFTRVHGFHKPEKGQQIIFYCRSGKRSATALNLAKQRGYRALRNYDGSYLDWQAKAGQDD